MKWPVMSMFAVTTATVVALTGSVYAQDTGGDGDTAVRTASFRLRTQARLVTIDPLSDERQSTPFRGVGKAEATRQTVELALDELQGREGNTATIQARTLTWDPEKRVYRGNGVATVEIGDRMQSFDIQIIARRSYGRRVVVEGRNGRRVVHRPARLVGRFTSGNPLRDAEGDTTTPPDAEPVTVFRGSFQGVRVGPRPARQTDDSTAG